MNTDQKIKEIESIFLHFLRKGMKGIFVLILVLTVISFAAVTGHFTLLTFLVAVAVVFWSLRRLIKMSKRSRG